MIKTGNFEWKFLTRMPTAFLAKFPLTGIWSELSMPVHYSVYSSYGKHSSHKVPTQEGQGGL